MQNCYWSVRCDAEYTQVLVYFFSFSVNVRFSPYCAIILPKNDFKTYFITTCKYQRCPIPWQKIYKCCFILFSIFWKTAMMFMWCIVFQLVAIIKKNTSCRRSIWLLLLTDVTTIIKESDTLAGYNDTFTSRVTARQLVWAQQRQ